MYFDHNGTKYFVEEDILKAIHRFYVKKYGLLTAIGIVALQSDEETYYKVMMCQDEIANEIKRRTKEEEN